MQGPCPSHLVLQNLTSPATGGILHVPLTFPRAVTSLSYAALRWICFLLLVLLVHSCLHSQIDWVPADTDCHLVCLHTGATSGTILSYASAPAIMARFNWQGLFVVYGCLGLLWCIFWIPLVNEDPPARQSQYPHGEGITGVGDVPWEKFVRSTAVWAIFVAQCTQGIHSIMTYICCCWQMHVTPTQCKRPAFIDFTTMHQCFHGIRLKEAE